MFKGATLSSEIKLANVKNILSAAFEDAKGLTKIEIPSSVGQIATDAFKNTGLSSIHISANVTELFPGIFDGCTSLTSARIDANYNTLGDSTFRNCINLSALHLGASIKYIADNCFMNCSSLIGDLGQYLPSKLAYIGANAFNGCTGLTAVTLPSTVNVVANDAFKGSNMSLRSVSFPGVKEIGAGAFNPVDSVSLISSFEAPSISSFSTNIFNSKTMTNLSRLSIPNVESINTEKIFQNSKFPELSSLNLANTKYLGTRALHTMPNLVDLTLTSIISLGDRVFNNDAKLKSLVLPSTLVSIRRLLL